MSVYKYTYYTVTWQQKRNISNVFYESEIILNKLCLHAFLEHHMEQLEINLILQVIGRELKVRQLQWGIFEQ